MPLDHPLLLIGGDSFKTLPLLIYQQFNTTRDFGFAAAMGNLLLVSAVANRDLAVVQCLLLLVAATMVSANLLVDALYGLIDPRLRAGQSRRAGA